MSSGRFPSPAELRQKRGAESSGCQRPSRRLLANAASVAPGYAGGYLTRRAMLRRLRPQNGLRHLRNALGAFVWRCPLRFRPLYATAPFAQKTGPRACGSGRAAPCRTRTPPDATQPARWLRSAWAPFVAACAWPLAGSAVAQPTASPHGAVFSRPQLFTSSVRYRAACPASVGGRQMNIMRNYTQHKRRAVRFAA